MIVKIESESGKHIAEFSINKNFRQTVHGYLMNIFELSDKTKKDRQTAHVTLNGLSWDVDKRHFQHIWNMMYNISTLDNKEKEILSQLLISEKDAKHLKTIKLAKRDEYQARKTKRRKSQ